MVGKTGGVRNLIREPAAMSSKTTIYVAIELSASSWLVAARLPGIQKVPVYRLESGDTMGCSNSSRTFAHKSRRSWA